MKRGLRRREEATLSLSSELDGSSAFCATRCDRLTARLEKALETAAAWRSAAYRAQYLSAASTLSCGKYSLSASALPAQADEDQADTSSPRAASNGRMFLVGMDSMPAGSATSQSVGQRRV